MKIAYVITRSDAIGGAQVHVRDLSLALINMGHRATVLVGGDGPFTEELAARGIPYRSLVHLARPIRPLTELKGSLEIRRALAELRPDLVSTHSSKAGWLGRLAARGLGIPVIFTAHGWAFAEGVPEGQRRFYALAERLAAPLADRIITVSECDCALALRYGVASPQKLVVIHNGMPDLGPACFARSESDPPRMVTVGRFEPQKDHPTLLRALVGLRNVSWELELVGDGPLLEPTKDFAARLGLAQRVRFLGARKNVAERLSKAQVFVLASHWEGFPRTILEAMRARLPVVASDVGGAREAVLEGETGFLVPRGAVEIMRERLQRLICDPDLAFRLGQAGRKRFEENFTLEKMVEKTLKVYRQTLGSHCSHSAS